MDNEKYQRILNYIRTQAPMECGVQALVYMFLDEIFFTKYGENVRILVADLRDNASIFGGVGGVLDLCIVNKDFIYVKKDSPKLKEQKKNRLGCVEIKALNENLAEHIEQVAGHIVEYGKVLYTDGAVWEYYCPTKKQKNILTKLLNSKETVELQKVSKEIDECKLELRKKYEQDLKNKRMTANTVQVLKNICDEEGKKVCDKLLILFKKREEIQKRNQILNGLENIMSNIIDNKNSWIVKLVGDDIKQNDIVTITESDFEGLKSKIRKIEWNN